MRREGLGSLGENQNHGRLQCCLGRCRRQMNAQRNALASPLFPSSSLLPLPHPQVPIGRSQLWANWDSTLGGKALGSDLCPVHVVVVVAGWGGGGEGRKRQGMDPRDRLAQEPTRRVRFWNSQDYFAGKKETCIPETGFSEGLSLRKNIFLYMFSHFLGFAWPGHGKMGTSTMF